jgi:hypothetical protein
MPGNCFLPLQKGSKTLGRELINLAPPGYTPTGYLSIPIDIDGVK